MAKFICLFGIENAGEGLNQQHQIGFTACFPPCTKQKLCTAGPDPGFGGGLKPPEWLSGESVASVTHYITGKLGTSPAGGREREKIGERQKETGRQRHTEKNDTSFVSLSDKAVIGIETKDSCLNNHNALMINTIPFSSPT